MTCPVAHKTFFFFPGTKALWFTANNNIGGQLVTARKVKERPKKKKAKNSGVPKTLNEISADRKEKREKKKKATQPLSSSSSRYPPFENEIKRETRTVLKHLLLYPKWKTRETKRIKMGESKQEKQRQHHRRRLENDRVYTLKTQREKGTLTILYYY